MGCEPIKIKNKLNTKERLNHEFYAMANDLAKITDNLYTKKVLGYGTSGITFLVENSITAQEKAVKVFDKKYASMDQIMKEVKIISNLNHPNIVRYITHYQSRRFFYIVMEYLGGGDLFQKVIAEEEFAEIEAANIMQKLLKSVAYLHNRGIIHRDLKPENIMYTSYGELKIIDFGFSVETDTLLNDSLVGTSYYIAPEIITNGIFTTKCDIWSLGIIMHAMISGYIPICGRSLEEIYNHIKNYKGPTFNTNIWNNISNDAKDLLKKMLEPSHIKRISASDALNHPWFNILKGAKQCREGSIVERFRRYSEFPETKKNILNLIVKNSNEFNIKNYKNVLTKLDKNNSGFITLYDIIKEVKSEIEKKELKELIKKISITNFGVISYNQFIAIFISTNGSLSEEKLNSLYKELTLDQQKLNSNERSSIMILNTRDSQASVIGDTICESSYLVRQGITLEEFKNILKN